MHSMLCSQDSAGVFCQGGQKNRRKTSHNGPQKDSLWKRDFYIKMRQPVCVCYHGYRSHRTLSTELCVFLKIETTTPVVITIVNVISVDYDALTILLGTMCLITTYKQALLAGRIYQRPDHSNGRLPRGEPVDPALAQCVRPLSEQRWLAFQTHEKTYRDCLNTNRLRQKNISSGAPAG